MQNAPDFMVGGVGQSPRGRWPARAYYPIALTVFRTFNPRPVPDVLGRSSLS